MCYKRLNGKSQLRYKLTILLICILGGNAFGDGKMYIPDGIPAKIPYQRAFLIHYNNFETLILQSKYEYPQTVDVNSVGWVVPVPSVPELASADADAANHFFLWTSISTSPHLIPIRMVLVLIFFLLFFAGILLSVIFNLLSPFHKILRIDKTKLDNLIDKTARFNNICFVIIMVSAPILIVYGLFSTAGTSYKGQVEVVKAEQVGIYDVKVIKSNSAESIINWMNENGYIFTEKDVKVFNDYVSRGWCFVTAKVRPDIDKQKKKIIYAGLVAPLIMKFKTDNAVYPLALTSVMGTKTEVLLYTLSEKKLTSNNRIALRYSREIDKKYVSFHSLGDAESLIMSVYEELPEQMYICKYKEILTPEKMEKDLVFEIATDNEPYNETRIIW